MEEKNGLNKGLSKVNPSKCKMEEKYDKGYSLLYNIKKDNFA